MAGGGAAGWFFEGYPVEEVKNRYGREPYRLQTYEQQAIEDIKKCLERGIFERNSEMLEENIVYVQSLIKKLTMVLATEQNEGLMNAELRSNVEEIKALYVKMMGKLQKEETKNL